MARRWTKRVAEPAPRSGLSGGVHLGLWAGDGGEGAKHLLQALHAPESEKAPRTGSFSELRASCDDAISVSRRFAPSIQHL
jgi:hypothetical protein